MIYLQFVFENFSSNIFRVREQLKFNHLVSVFSVLCILNFLSPPDGAAKAIAALPTNQNAAGNIFFAAPNGSNSGSGSMDDPWSLRTALNQPSAVKPGDTIYLRGGRYTIAAGDPKFSSYLTGTAENPIKVMSYPGEWAILDGTRVGVPLKQLEMFYIKGAYTWFMNFEITNSELETRKIAINGSNPPERRGDAVLDNGSSIKLINLVIHDAGEGIFSSPDINGSEYYGNVVYNNGWDTPAGTNGHGNYVQNISGTKSLENNFFFNNFAFNSQMYGGSGHGFTWTGNVFFNGDMAWWGPNISNLTVKDNFTYNHLFRMGNSVTSTNTDADIEGNYFMSGVFLDQFSQHVTFKNNTVWYDSTLDSLVTLHTKDLWTPAKFTIDYNTYYKGGIMAVLGQFRVFNQGGKTRVPIVQRLTDFFAFNKTSGSQQASYNNLKKSWQDDLGFDIHSTWIDSAPTGVKVFIRPNKYDPHRGNIIIYNWNQADTVSVDVSSILSPGDKYALHSVQDYFGDVTNGTYSGGQLTINMTNRTVAKPIGYDQSVPWYHDPIKPTTFPTFGTFVIIKTN